MWKEMMGGNGVPPVPLEGSERLPFCSPLSHVGRTYASPRKRLGQTSSMWLSMAARRTHSKRCSEDSVGGW